MALRLLLADEGSSIKKAFELALKDFGVTIKAVHQGVDVKEVFESFKPHISFVDVLLPKLNGYDACSVIKKESSQKDSPVVLMWSGFMELDPEKFKSCAADGSLEKPFETKTLRSLVTSLVPSLSGNEISQHVVIEEDIKGMSAPQESAASNASNLPDLPPLKAEFEEEQNSISRDDLPDLPDLDSLLKDPDEELPALPDEDDDESLTLSGPVGLELDEFDTSLNPHDQDADSWLSESMETNVEEVQMAPEGLDDIDSFAMSSLEDLPVETASEKTNFSSEDDEKTDPSLEHNDSLNVQATPDLPFDEESELPQLSEKDEHDPEEIEPLKVVNQEDTSDDETTPSVEVPQLSKEELKHLILAQSKDIIESVVWDVVPELAKEMIQKEIKRLTGEIKYEEDLR